MVFTACNTAPKHYDPITGDRSKRISIAALEALNARPDLDFGIYFFDAAGNSSRAVPGQPIANFDPAKPTVIYLHGWERGTTVRNFRESYLVEDIVGFTGQLTNTPWKKAGWNTGIFYWNQFADEPEVKTAEAKIWTYRSPYKMRYRVTDGSFVSSQAEFTIAEIFATYYRDVFQARPATAGEN